MTSLKKKRSMDKILDKVFCYFTLLVTNSMEFGFMKEHRNLAIKFIY